MSVLCRNNTFKKQSTCFLWLQLNVFLIGLKSNLMHKLSYHLNRGGDSEKLKLLDNPVVLIRI